MAIVWDAPAQTLRQQEYAEYKANRPSIPDDFRQQIPLIKKYCQRAGFHTFEYPWYEADDIIWTLALSSSEQCEVYTADKDMKQLLSEKIHIVDPMKDIKRTKDSFLQENWFDSCYFLDYLAMIWDVADNIPWIMWVGPKTAQKLVIKYWSLDWIYDHLDEIDENLRNKLISWREQVYKAKWLMRMMEVPDIKKLDLCEVKLDYNELKRLFVEEVGFPSMVRSIDQIKSTYTVGVQGSLFW